MKWDTFFVHTNFLYARTKFVYSATLSTQKCLAGEIANRDALATFWKNFFKEKMTFLYRSEGEEMAPTIPGKNETLLVRNLPCPDLEFRLSFKPVSVGDVVLLTNPLDSDKFLVRRLAALGGHEMVSSDEKDEPFVIEHDQCWVLSDNKKLKTAEAKDSRTFGPVSIMNIMGRVIYRFQSMKDHGPVHNSEKNTKEDSAVVKFELKLNEMQKMSEA